MDSRERQLASRIARSQKVVVFTGAGISTESGIPDFRSPGGLWSQYNPEDFTYQRFLSSKEARVKYWQMSTTLYEILKKAKPNAAHRAVAELERLGKLDCVITQNIDGLHQAAGIDPHKVIELHGTALAVKCLQCDLFYERDPIQERISAGEEDPRCDTCGGLLKPATISFGQSMPEKETREAFRRAEASDLFLVVGSSLVVQPAASLPLVAKEAGAFLAIVNRDPTPQDSLADTVIYGNAGPVLSRVVEDLRRLLEADQT
jgi:NAD-dependent deacetylase